MSRNTEQAKAEHTMTTESENSGAADRLVIVKFLQSPAAPLVEASVSVTLMLYEPAGNPF